MKNFGKLTGYQQNGQDILLDFEGQSARITVLTSKIVNVFCALESEKYHSKAVEGDKKQEVALTVEGYQSSGTAKIYRNEIQIEPAES